MKVFLGGPMVTTKNPQRFPPAFRPPFREPRGIPLGYHFGSLSERSLLGSASWIPEPCSDITGHEVEPKNMQPATVGYLLLVDVGCFVLLCWLVGWLVVVAVVLVQYCLCFRLLDFFNPPKRWSLQINGGKTSPTTAYSEIPLMVQKSGKLTS